MLLPSYVNLAYYFYPIGNTPAVNLLRDVDSRASKSIRVLSLACDSGTAFEFIVCDYEAAVLARNVFFFTFVRDSLEGSVSENEIQKRWTSLWNIFYHFYLSSDDLAILQDHASKLCSLAQSCQAWNNSEYGHITEFLNEGTFSRVQSFWKSYADTRNFSAADARAFDKRNRESIAAICKEYFADERMVLNGARSAGAHCIEGTTTMSQAFKAYWKTGVVAGNGEDLAALGSDKKGLVNPLFAFSSAPAGNWAVHYGSEPLLGFPLADAFDDLGWNEEGKIDLAGAAKRRFREWCSSFARYISRKAVKISIHWGEAVNCCYELQSRSACGRQMSKVSHSYTAPWTANKLALSLPPKANVLKAFDVIDTSNLIDSVGLLNLLPATAPLLGSTPSAVLYTESLLRSAEETWKTLSELLFSDPGTFCLLIGLAPVGFLTGTTSDGIGAEAALAMTMAKTVGRQQQFRIRVPWKRPTDGDVSLLRAPPSQPQIDCRDLAHFLYATYLKIFAYEDLSNMTALLARTQRQLLTPLAGDLRYYSRVVFASLVRLMSTHVITDIRKCVDTLLEMIEEDRTLILGTNNLQELYMHLYLSGLWDASGWEYPRLVRTHLGPQRSTHGETGLLATIDLPVIVHVVLVVPRAKLRLFAELDPKRRNSPGLHLSVFSDGHFENTFFGLDCFFGTIKRTEAADTCEVEPDIQGWSGSSNLIVTCPVPTWSLLMGPRRNIGVALVVNTSPSTMQYSRKLGLNNRVYEARLDDKDRLLILRNIPGSCKSSVEGPLEAIKDCQSMGIEGSATAAFSTQGVCNLSLKAELDPNAPKADLLRAGAGVSVSQRSPCSLDINVEGGKDTVLMRFPFPVNGSASRTRIARKSSWIQLTAPIASASSAGGYHVQPFPLVGLGPRPVPWGIGRTNIDQQPPLRTKGSLEWLDGHLGMTLSRSERDAQKACENTSAPLPVMVQFKETIGALLKGFLGAPGGQKGQKTLRLVNLSTEGDCDTVIILNSLRHDLDTGSVLLEAFVVPLTDERLHGHLLGPLKKLTIAHGNTAINVSREEGVLWKQALPAFVERCRYTWEHRAKCEYVSKAAVPLSTEHGKMATPVVKEKIRRLFRRSSQPSNNLLHDVLSRRCPRCRTLSPWSLSWRKACLLEHWTYRVFLARYHRPRLVRRSALIVEQSRRG